MKIINKQAIQVHPVPDKVTAPQGPFPPELTLGHPLSEPDIIYEYEEAYAEDGSEFLPGATVQNNYKPLRYLRCSVCSARVIETETELHICED